MHIIILQYFDQIDFLKSFGIHEDQEEQSKGLFLHI